MNAMNMEDPERALFMKVMRRRPQAMALTQGMRITGAMWITPAMKRCSGDAFGSACS